MIKVGDVIDGRYEIKARIDGGAMGEVFRVFDRRLDCFRALKLLKDGKEHDPQWVERFKREAQAPSKIGSHLNVVAVHEYVSGHSDEQNRYINHYIVMELAEGDTLADLLSAARLSLEQAIEIMEGICNGVGAAHRINIVHRDLKPKNVIICPTSSGKTAKIIDFGLAKLPDASSGGDLTLLTEAGAKLGTARYRAPEQEIDPSTVGSRADVYSLGCIFYEILSGYPPFRSNDMTKLVRQHQSMQPQPFKTELAIPVMVEDVLMRALKKRVAERQKDASELGSQLLEAFTRANDERTRTEQEHRQRQEAENWRSITAELEILKIENQDLHEVEELLLANLKSAEEERHFRAQEAKTLQSETAELKKKAEEQRKKGEAENRRVRSEVQALTQELEAQKQTAEAMKQDAAKLVNERELLQQDTTSLRLESKQIKSKTEEEQRKQVLESQKLHTEIVALTRVVDAWKAQFGDQSAAGQRLNTLNKDLARWKQTAEGANRDVARLQADKTSLEQQILKLRTTSPVRDFRNRRPIRAFLLTVALLTIGGCAVYFGRDALTNIGSFKWPQPNVNENNNRSVNTQEPANQRNDTTAPIATVQPTPPAGMVYVPGGTFQMGRNTTEGGEAYDAPSHAVTIPPFFMDMHEVTNADFAEFVNATKHQSPTTWTTGSYPSGASKKPVTGVTWDDAVAYARWAGKRLPTEAEWEFAARGTTGFVYPWGNQWEKGSLSRSRSNEPSDVGSNTNNKSPFGVFDMVGNVWEWTTSDLRAYPGGTLPSSSAGSNLKVIRGCMYKCNLNQMTTTYRRGWPATGNYEYKNTGFRCAKGVTK